jgi:hypothetical protein
MSAFLRITRCKGSVASALQAGLESTATRQYVFQIVKLIWFLVAHMDIVMSQICVRVKKAGKETNATSGYVRIVLMESAWLLMIVNVFMVGKA